MNTLLRALNYQGKPSYYYTVYYYRYSVELWHAFDNNIWIID